MPLPKLNLAPESSKFSATAGAAVVGSQVAGGLSRVRLAQLGAPLSVALEWVCDVGEMAYLGAFYRSMIANGSQPFLIDLIVGYSAAAEQTAIFLPGSFQISGQAGNSYLCQATLEVTAPARNAVADAALVAARAAPVGGLPVMVLTPSAASYSVQRGATVLRSQPGLGPSAIREDRYNTSSIMSASWNVGPADFDYLNAFYFTATAEGALPFLVDSVLDHPDVRQLKGLIVPGTFGLQSVSGLTYSVVANVEVVPVRSADYDAAVLALFEDFGGDWPELLDVLDRLVNVDMPTWD